MCRRLFSISNYGPWLHQTHRAVFPAHPAAQSAPWSELSSQPQPNPHGRGSVIDEAGVGRHVGTFVCLSSLTVRNASLRLAFLCIGAPDTKHESPSALLHCVGPPDTRQLFHNRHFSFAFLRIGAPDTTHEGPSALLRCIWPPLTFLGPPEACNMWYLLTFPPSPPKLVQSDHGHTPSSMEQRNPALHLDEVLLTMFRKYSSTRSGHLEISEVQSCGQL
jgi:hypothetical protein